jgi:hypothetical protein
MNNPLPLPLYCNVLERQHGRPLFTELDGPGTAPAAA